MNQSLRAKQINYYYPYGLTFADAGKGAGVQPCKHGGKELDAMYGLCRSDFGARHLSPYLYCANNPFNLIDPDDREIVTWLENMKYVYRKFEDNSFGFVDTSGKRYDGPSVDMALFSDVLEDITATKTGNALVSDQGMSYRESYTGGNAMYLYVPIMDIANERI